MKKLFISLAAIAAMLFTPVAHAALNATVVTLKDTSNVEFSTYSLTSGSAVRTRSLNVHDNNGFATLLITEDQAGGTGDVDIFIEYSLDRTNWYRAYTSDMAGTITIEGNVVTALSNVTRWIVFTPRLAPHMRIVFDPDANSQITAQLIFQEDR